MKFLNNSKRTHIQFRICQHGNFPLYAPTMAYNSLNDYIQFLTERRQLKRVSHPLHPQFEVTTLADAVLKSQGPALLLEKVVGSDFPILINALGTEQRMAWALGVEKIDDLASAAAEIFKNKSPTRFWERDKSDFQPKHLHFGPCQQVIQDKPNLSLLPALTAWPEEAGPSILFGITVTQNWERKQNRLELNRIQVLDEKTLGIEWSSQSRGKDHFEEFAAKKMKMPVAIFIGGDPLLTWLAHFPLLTEIDSFHLAGVLRKKKLPLVKCLTQNLQVPAEADFILEGFIDPKEEWKEGRTYADTTGHYSTTGTGVKFHITGITHKQYPVYFAAIPAIPPNEFSFLGKATERMLLPFFKRLFPEIRDIRLPSAGCFQNLALVSIRKKYPGHGQKIMHSLWGSEPMMHQRCLIVLDHDVDIQKNYETLWRLSGNTDASRDFIFAEGPISPENYGATHPLVGSKFGIDATRKWPEEKHFRTWPEELHANPEMAKKVAPIFREIMS